MVSGKLTLGAAHKVLSRCRKKNARINSLDAQREACAAFILSQKHEGWTVLPTLYDDGGFSGGTMVQPALKRLRSVAMTNSPYPPILHVGHPPPSNARPYLS